MKKIILTAVLFAVLMVAASLSVSAAETVEWIDLTHNGTDTQLPTQLTITFSKPVSGLKADLFTVSGATRGALTQSESTPNIYYLEISNIKEPDSYSTNKTIFVYIGYISGYTFTPSSKIITIERLKYGDWEFWTNTDDTVTLRKYIGYDTDVEIPATIAGRKVTKLDGTFKDYKSLKSITIPNGVTSIGDYTFYYCENLISITIPNSVTSIGNWAFAICSSLKNITIPNNVKSIGNGAFSNCRGFTNVIIPNSVTSIGNGAFRHCSNLSSVILSDGLISIGEEAFSGYISGNKCNYSVVEEWGF